MRVIYSTTLLASPQLALGRVGPFELGGPNGEAIVDEFNFFRADFATLYARGRKARQFTFKVTALFNSEAGALYFLATHEDVLPQQADLILVDEDDTRQLVMEDAVVSVQFGRVRGASVEVTYLFRGARFTSEDVIEDLEEDTDRMKVGTQPITIEDESAAVVFANPFASTPRSVGAIIEAPTGEPAVAVVGVRDVSLAGFTVVFAAAVPAADYVLRWKATL